MKTKFYYLAAVAVASVGILLTSCETTGEETIVEKEVLVADNSDAALMGLSGNPKSVLEEYSESATKTGTTVDLGTVSLKSECTFNSNRNMTASKKFKSILMTGTVDEEGWIVLTNPQLKEVEAITNTYNADGILTGIEKTEQDYSLYIDGTLIPNMYIEGSQIDTYRLKEDLGIETFEVIEWRPIAQRKYVTTINPTTKKATRITSSKYDAAWEEESKEILDIDANGRPNEFSKENYASKAFEETPTSKLIEEKDVKGNWVLRYSKEINGDYNSSVTKRKIVYY